MCCRTRTSRPCRSSCPAIRPDPLFAVCPVPGQSLRQMGGGQCAGQTGRQHQPEWCAGSKGQCGAEGGTGRDADQAGFGQRVAELRLQAGAAQGQQAAGRQGQYQPGCPQLQDQRPGEWITVPQLVNGCSGAQQQGGERNQQQQAGEDEGQSGRGNRHGSNTTARVECAGGESGNDRHLSAGPGHPACRTGHDVCQASARRGRRHWRRSGGWRPCG